MDQQFLSLRGRSLRLTGLAARLREQVEPQLQLVAVQRLEVEHPPRRRLQLEHERTVRCLPDGDLRRWSEEDLARRGGRRPLAEIIQPDLGHDAPPRLPIFGSDRLVSLLLQKALVNHKWLQLGDSWEHLGNRFNPFNCHF